MLYAYWFIGLLLAITFAVLMALMYELKADPQKDSE